MGAQLASPCGFCTSVTTDNSQQNGKDQRLPSVRLEDLPMCPKVGCTFAFLAEFSKTRGLVTSSVARSVDGSTSPSSPKRAVSSTAPAFTMGSVCNDIIKPKTIYKKEAKVSLLDPSWVSQQLIRDYEAEEYEFYSYAELAMRDGRLDSKGRPAFGNATHFVSHAWRYDFRSFVEALANWLKQTGADEEKVYFWVDAFVINQHQSQSYPQEWWSTRFMQAVGEIGNTVLILEPWDDPVPLTRAWVIWELYCTSATGARLHLTMRPETMDNFYEGLVTSFERVQTALSNVDVSKSEAFHKVDQEMIHNEIKRTLGFTKLNELIQTRLLQWLAETAKGRLQVMIENEQSMAVKTPSEDRVKLQNNLARMLREIGLLSDAEASFRKLLVELEVKLGRDHEHTLSCMNQLAVTLQKMGQVLEAAKLHRDGLQTRIRVFGPTHADTLQSTSNLAVLLSQQKPLSETDFTEAQTLFRQAIAGREATLGADHPSTLYTVSNLARLLSEAPKPSRELFDEAEALHVRAVTSLSAKLHDSHPLTLFAAHNEACHRMLRFRFNPEERGVTELEIALDRLQNVVTSRTEKLGQQHADTVLSAQALKDCAMLLRDSRLSHEIDRSLTWAQYSVQEFHEMVNGHQFLEIRRRIQEFGVDLLRKELVNTGFVDEVSGRLTTGMQPFNIFARIASGVMHQATMAEEQPKLGEFSEQFMLACNRSENDDNWASTDPSWIGKASMSKRHRFLIQKDLAWEWFNVLTFGLVSGLDAGIKMLKDLKTAALLWASLQTDWPPIERIGLFVQVYAITGVPSFHLHILDMDNLGPTFEIQRFKNLPLDEAIWALEQEQSDLATALGLT